MVSQQGVTVDKKSSSIMMVLSVFSPDERYTSTYIDNYTNLYVLEELKRVPGANRAHGVRAARHRHARLAAARPHGAARHLGAGRGGRASRARTRPSASARSARQPTPPGVQQTFVVTAQGLLTKPEEFENIIVRAAKEGTAIVRVRDIGRVELAKRDYSIASRMNGKTATTIGDLPAAGRERGGDRARRCARAWRS